MHEEYDIPQFCSLNWKSSVLIKLLLQKRHKRTFSEDERIQAQENVKKVEDDDVGEISEPEDPMMLQREAKDWKVWALERYDLGILTLYRIDSICVFFPIAQRANCKNSLEPRPLRRLGSFTLPL